ncbi:MAG: 4-hydroxy-tetrahydrodipicolinate reductase [Rickettsiales bacterium]|nr:4-hydroxy-tetrahydrodipicolinate reductase [Rickettsiales bacterium]
MKKISVGVFGPDGRMGRDVIEQLKNDKGFQIKNICEKKGNKTIGKKINGIIVDEDINKLISNVEVIIDFTIPEATISLMAQMKKLRAKTALVSGTTGYTYSQEKKFMQLSKGLRVLRSFNMSVGINIVKKLLESTSKNISDISDIEIVETHHNKKRDIPSGTALTLADSINEASENHKNFSFREKTTNKLRKKNEIGFSSIRGGDVVGDHTVFFFLDGERIEISHKAHSRKIFSLGAIKAAKWIIKKKPGLYTIKDMLI